MTWFERLTGFAELPYAQTQERLEVVGARLRSKVNGASWGIGRLELPTLAELRARGAPLLAEVPGALRAELAVGDVRAFHSAPASAGALFQVASQFNLLEMMDETVAPEDGVTRYERDRTQGPACAMAAAAALLYRNYLVPVGTQVGQTEGRQLDALADLAAALGLPESGQWQMRNGYALGTRAGVAEVGRRLAGASEAERDAYRATLRIGLHWDVEVTDAAAKGATVSQAFCSALPVSYGDPDIPKEAWAPFATLVLEAAYEATLWAGVLNAARGASRTVFLTLLGGGAFGNELGWIEGALTRAAARFRGAGLTLVVVSFRAPDARLRQLVETLGRG
ncbi:MAG: hypothetical protein K1X89_25885 [Myxococcaceae bacterium]|nr:hypothetical protein [Myxococcaceae bacterium]